MSTLPLAIKVIDEWLCYQTKNADLPGFQTSIRKSGKLIFNKAYGFAHLPSQEKYTTHHLGRLASHSKMFTSCLAFRLQDEGVLRLDDKIINHLPQFRLHKDKRFKDITLRHLLTNRSGLFRDGLDSPFWELEAPFLSRADLEAVVFSTDLIYDPNQYSKYSNIGFSLLGLALEAAAKADYTTLVTRYVLSKLGDHQLVTEYTSDKKYKFAHGHTRKIYTDTRKAFKQTTTDGMIAATGFCGNTESISDYLHKLYHTNEILPQHVRYDLMNLKWPMKNLTEDFYGLGMMFNCGAGFTLAGHGGGYPGFTSRTQALLGTEYVFSTITNCNETFAQDPLRTMAEIIHKIESVFKPSEANQVIVTKPMVNNWGISLYVVGKEKALVLPLGSWLPVTESTTLSRHKDGYYYSHEIQGYGSVGEPVHFVYKDRDVKMVKFASYTSHPIEVYIKRTKSRFAH